MRASAFVPGHISGFFEPCLGPRDPLRRGSRNCGPCISLGVYTDVKIRSRSGIWVRINGRRAKASTTAQAVRQTLRALGEEVGVEVSHTSPLPQGAGYGTSGAGALGAVLALSKALGLKLPRSRAVGIAHQAELMQGTGLGDVGAQALGGLVVGLVPGAPPYGRWRRIPVKSGIKVVCATLGQRPTPSLLAARGFMAQARKQGAKALRKLLKRLSPREFLRASREFAKALGLVDDELRSLIEASEEAGAMGASVAMLGRTVFALAGPSEAEGVRESLVKLVKREAVAVAEVDRGGARLLEGVLVH